MDNKLEIKSFYIPLIYFFAALFMEAGMFVALNFGFYPKYVLFNIAVMLVFFGIIFICYNFKIQMIVSLVLLTVQLVLSFINVTIYAIYGDLFSFDMINMGGEAFTSFDPSFINWWFLIYVVVVMVSAIILMVLVIKRKFKLAPVKNIAVLLACLFTIIEGVGFATYSTQYAWLKNEQGSSYDKYFNNDVNLYHSLFIKSEGLKKFGSFGFYAKNLANLIFKTNMGTNDNDQIKNYILNGEMSKANNYTGSIAGDNFIVIMCESLEWYAIDPVLTPTLYELFYNGVTLNNYYSKSKTNYSEMDVILGSIPTNNQFTNGLSSNDGLLKNTIPFSLPSKLLSEGYESAKYFHGNNGSFYSRNDTHLTYGFDEVVALEKLDFTNIETGNANTYHRDSDIMKASINKLAPTDKKFVSFLTTLITHGPYRYNEKLTKYYDVLNSGKFEEYLDWLDSNTNYVVPTTSTVKDTLKYYKAAVMDLDKSLEYLVTYLKQNNLFNNTTLFLYSDHNAYYHDLSYDMRGVEKEEYYNNELYRVPAAIYSSKLNKEQINGFTCPYNILPTIFDLLGVSYNKNLYISSSIFSDDLKNTIFVSPIGGIMKDEIYSDDVNVLYALNHDLTDEEIALFKQNALDYYTKQDWLNEIYNKDIFKHFPELKNHI